MNDTTTHAVDDDGIDIKTLMQLIAAGRWFILCFTALCVAGGAVYAFMAREWFQADVVLMQTENRSVSSTLSQLSGLASLAGVNIGTGGQSSEQAVAVLRSREFARDFIQGENLLHVVLFDEWDTKAGRWRETKPAEQPDIRDAVARFDKTVRQISEDKKTGLVTLSITWTDPQTAADWANLLVRLVNAKLRNQAIVEAEGNIKYLQGEMAATNITALQQSIGRVLESEMQKLMLARGAEQFAFKVIDSATAPKRRIRPQRALILVVSAVFGVLASVSLLLIRRKYAR